MLELFIIVILLFLNDKNTVIFLYMKWKMHFNMNFEIKNGFRYCVSLFLTSKHDCFNESQVTDSLSPCWLLIFNILLIQNSFTLNSVSRKSVSLSSGKCLLRMPALFHWRNRSYFVQLKCPLYLRLVFIVKDVFLQCRCNEE